MVSGPTDKASTLQRRPSWAYGRDPWSVRWEDAEDYQAFEATIIYIMTQHYSDQRTPRGRRSLKWSVLE
jgi:hypothetical protein